jgi:DNA modification methylase
MTKQPSFNTHRQWNEKAMTDNEMARNSDWHLLFEVLKNQGVMLNETQKFHILHSGVNMHTLLRERRRIQKEGLLIPTDQEVAKKRKLYQEYFEQNYSK